MSNLTIYLPDGSKREVPSGSTGMDLAMQIGPGLARAAVAMMVNSTESDLTSTVPPEAKVAIITSDTEEGRTILRHSTAHVLAQAVLQLFKGARYSIGPAIADGFYYDFELPDNQTFSDGDLKAIEARMHEIVAADQPFVRSEVNVDQAMQLFHDQPFKCEIIKRAAEGVADHQDAGEVGGLGVISLYRNSDSFVDLCRGPHVPSTGRLGHFSLMKVAGAYWRGNEKGPMLQRIYGTAFESKAALAEHLHRLEEASKRDHRRLAVEMDLLSFPQELGGGLAVWHPKGGTIRKIIEDYSRQRHQNGGYEFVFTPHLANANLFETSGHLQFYKDGMYPPMDLDNGTYYPKPMNCPMHCLIFRERQRSYRDLPMRLFELGTVYRYERAGTLHGLLRTRGFTQDDSHIFCTEEQMSAEIASLLDFVMSVLRRFGFSDFDFRLSTRNREKSVGSDEIWTKATAALIEALEIHGVQYSIADGDAAFYGPKIDIDVQDAIGRKWQLSTIQCDFNMPERFGLEYIGSNNARRRPIMLHRALLGSIERFFGVLIEHYAGSFPTWLAPIQVRVLPVATAHVEYSRQVSRILESSGLRVDELPADEQLGKRIKVSKMDRIPYILVVGDEDIKNETVGVNPRGGAVHRNVKVQDFLEQIKFEIAE